MRMLAVDTCTRAGSVAVLDDGIVAAEISTTVEQTHAKRLMSTIDVALAMVGTSVQGCDSFAVTTGPGSFTGLRIGISTVKGLAVATGKPVTGVSALHALACQFPLCQCAVCPMLDARKGQVYTALYSSGPDLALNETTEPCAVEPAKWLDNIHGECLFVGDGTAVYGDLIREILGVRAHFAPSYLNGVRASVVGAIGMKHMMEGRTEEVSSLEPYYIRKSDAEIKRGG